MPTRGVIRRDRKNHSNLRPKHKHTKNYLQHYWPYLPMMVLMLIGLWFVRPGFLRASHHGVLAYATNVTDQSLLKSTNLQRENNGQKDLKLNAQLSSAAQSKAQDMVNRNYWSHNTPDGSPPWLFITNAGYQYEKAGENLAYGFNNPNETINGWMNSPTHRKNLLDPDFTEVGFGSANSSDFNSSGQVTVVVAMYGRPTTEPPVLQVVNGENKSPQGFTNQQKTAPTEAKSISRIEALTSGRMPWITSAISFMVGAAVGIMLIKHSLSVKKAFKKGERYVVTHPMLDIVLVSIVLLGLIVTAQVGTIL